MKLGIVGSRSRNTLADKELIRQQILKLHPTELVSGGCPVGADRFAEELAAELGLPIRIFLPEALPAGVPRHVRTKAFYRRNEHIAVYSDVIVACVSTDRKGGTENTLRHAKRHGRRAIII